MKTGRVCLFFTLALLAQIAQAQTSAVALDPLHAWDAHVTGRSGAAGRVAVYDVTYPVPAKLGEADVSKDGTFAVAIKVLLREGNVIVVEDALSRRTVPVVVQGPRAGPVPSAAR